MEPFEIFVTFISWGSGGKNRPILVILINDSSLLAYPITTQYGNKSDSIQAQYYKMNDWLQAGFKKQSYIDTGTLIKLPLSAITNKYPIGRLTEAEKQKLLEFLNR
jgi:hypothetical protein